MSLATRCASCNTVFRVVQDQLKVSEGWVRCGRCDSVFNALEGLFDLGREAPPDWDGPAYPGAHGFADSEASDPGFAPTMSPPLDTRDVALRALSTGGPLDTGFQAGAQTAADLGPGTAPASNPDGAAADEPTPSSLEERFADPMDAHLFGPRKRADSAPKPAGQIGARDRLDFSDARFDSDLFAENTLLAEGDDLAPAVTDVAALPLESTSRPDFLRRADRRAIWRSGPVRAAMAAASVALALLLLVQIGHHARDVLAAEWPATRPVLVAWCSATGCTLEPPRRLDDVLVESTALTRVPSGDAFTLTVNLRNRGALALQLPYVDLNLTDVNGRLVARRALAPRDFKVASVLPAGAETALQLTLAAGSAVAGYTVEIFYP